MSTNLCERKSHVGSPRDVQFCASPQNLDTADSGNPSSKQAAVGERGFEENTEHRVKRRLELRQHSHSAAAAYSLKRHMASTPGEARTFVLPVPPQKPKRPAKAYVQFMSERRAHHAGMSGMAMMDAISKEWQELDDAAKKAYDDKYQLEEAAYKDSASEYEGKKLAYEKEVVELGKAAQSSLDFDMANVRQALEVMVEELKSRSDITVTKHRILPGLEAAQLDKATELLGADLPAGVREFYSACGGFELEWALKAESKEADRGCVNILPLLEGDGKLGLGVCSSWEGSIWFTDHEGTLARTRYALDQTNTGSSRLCSTMCGIRGGSVLGCAMCGADAGSLPGGERFKGVRPLDHFTPEARDLRSPKSNAFSEHIGYAATTDLAMLLPLT
eukprot:1447019-Rhodomonas_salina.2